MSVTGPGGGAEEIVLRNASRIDPERFKMSISVIRDIVDEQFNFTDRARALGIETYEVFQRGMLDRSVGKRLAEIVEAIKPRIIHAHGYKPVFHTWRLKRRHPIIPIATLHGWTGHTPRERFIYYPAERRLLRSFPRIVAVSEDLRETYLRSGGRAEQVTVLLNGVDPEDFDPQPGLRKNLRQQLDLGPNEIAICGVGRVEPQKRFDVLLESMALLHNNQPKLRLFICGTGSKDEEIRACIQRLNLNETCAMLGHRADMRDLYHAFDMFVQSSDYEGTPTVLVEAMACRLPIVATDVGGTTQLVRPDVDALIVPRREPEKLAAAITRTIEDQAATQQRVAAGRQRVETDLSFRSRLDRLTAIYDELLSRDDVTKSTAKVTSNARND
ncbi:MAG: glycosyltransferase [Pirellulales bacterium]|nr:glycosyltransferase [Pirellulales bacterium]